MIESFESLSHPIQDDRQLRNKLTGSTLKLVVSNPLPIQKVIPSQTRNSSTGFTAETRMRAPSLYVLVAHEHCHYLDCELTLELEEDGLNSLAVICHFPDISDEELNDFVWEDETLLGMILIQFQMKILKQLLLFCASNNAKNLVIRIDEAQSKKLEIYRKIVVYEDNIPAKKGKLIEMTIPANPKTFENWVNFMDEVGQKFRQTLWQDQRTNPAIRAYLKSNSSLSVFC